MKCNIWFPNETIKKNLRNSFHMRSDDVCIDVKLVFGQIVHIPCPERM